MCRRTQCLQRQDRQESLTALASSVRWSPNPAVRCGEEPVDSHASAMHSTLYGGPHPSIWFAAAGNCSGTRSSSIPAITSFAGQTARIGLSESHFNSAVFRLPLCDLLVGSMLWMPVRQSVYVLPRTGNASGRRSRASALPAPNARPASSLAGRRI